MLQCYVCSEWYHHQCIGIPNVEDETDEFEFICNSCLSRHFSFLNKYPPELETTIKSTKIDEDDVDILGVELQSNQSVNIADEYPALGKIVTGGRFLPEEWQNRLNNEDRELLPEETIDEVTAPDENRRENTSILLRASTINTQSQLKSEKIEESSDIDIDAEILKAKEEGDRDKARKLVYKKFLSVILKQSNLNRRVTVTEEDVKQALRRQGPEVIVSPLSSQNSQQSNENDINNLKHNSINGHSESHKSEELKSSPVKVTGKRKLEINKVEDEEERSEKHQKVEESVVEPSTVLTTEINNEDEEVTIVD